MDFKKIFAEGLSVAIGLIIATIVISIVMRLLWKKKPCGCGGQSSDGTATYATNATGSIGNGRYDGGESAYPGMYGVMVY